LDCSCLNSILNSATSITGRQLYNGLGELARHRLTSPHPTQGGELLESVEHFLFAPNGQVLHLTAENGGGTATDVIWVDNLPVAQLVASYDAGGLPQGTPALTYLHPDHLGSPRLGTNAARQVTWRWESEAFGQNTPNVPMGSAIVRLRFPGQIDLNIGLLAYNYYRTYDPLLGRYLESDPIGVEGGLNTYGYVAQNPLTMADPTGEIANVVAGAVTGVVTGYLIAKATGDECYNLSDALADAALGATGAGLVSKLNKLYRVRALRKLADQRGLRARNRTGSVEEYNSPTNTLERLRIKHEPGRQAGLGPGSSYPRFDYRVAAGLYKDPFTGQVGRVGPLSHIPLEPFNRIGSGVAGAVPAAARAGGCGCD
jgi:RHS repeat-associated protein